MVKLNMIGTVGSGSLRMFLAQKKRCFPLPDYDFSNHEVHITVDACCWACVTPESHKTALMAMKPCQINMIEE